MLIKKKKKKAFKNIELYFYVTDQFVWFCISAKFMKDNKKKRLKICTGWFKQLIKTDDLNFQNADLLWIMYLFSY